MDIQTNIGFLAALGREGRISDPQPTHRVPVADQRWAQIWSRCG